MRLVTDPAEVPALVSAIDRAAVSGAEVGFDCEFLSQDRLVPQLCLLQLVWEEEGERQISLVDCLAVDSAPIARALAAHPRPVAHAPRQDLQLLFARFGVELPQVFDLQIAAAFLGLGDQLGYAKLAAAVLGLELTKDSQWTDWARRPLSAAQLAYASADVEHLLPLYRALVERLGPRLAWVIEESSRLSSFAKQAAVVREDAAWEDVAGAGGLPPRAQAVVAELAAWRLATARQLDRPLGHILPDKSIVELARRPPKDLEALRRRGATGVVRERAEELFDRLTTAETREPPARPSRRGPLSRRAEEWVSGLLLIVELVAGSEQIAPRFLATRSDVESLARLFEAAGDAGVADHPVMNGWRRALLGELCLGWLHGELAIVNESAPGEAGAGTSATIPARPLPSSVKLVQRGKLAEPA